MAPGIAVALALMRTKLDPRLLTITSISPVVGIDSSVEETPLTTSLRPFSTLICPVESPTKSFTRRTTPDAGTVPAASIAKCALPRMSSTLIWYNEALTVVKRVARPADVL